MTCQHSTLAQALLLHSTVAGIYYVKEGGGGPSLPSPPLPSRYSPLQPPPFSPSYVAMLSMPLFPLWDFHVRLDNPR